MTDIEKIQAYTKVGEVITDIPKPVTITSKPDNIFEKFLMKIGVMKKERTFEISPILVGNRYKVSIRAMNIPNDIFFDGKVEYSRAWETIQNHTDDLIYIVALCIQNNKKEPHKDLIEYLRWVDDEKFFKLLDNSLTMAGIRSFMKSIILIHGANVLNVQAKVARPAMVPE